MTNQMINHIEVKNRSNNMVNCYLISIKTQDFSVKNPFFGSFTETVSSGSSLISKRTIYRQPRKQCGKNTACYHKSLI